MELPQQEETGGAGDLMNALLPEPPQDETAVTEYVTVRLSGVSDVELMNQLEEHLPDGAYTKPVDNSAYLLNLFLAYILPILVMVGLFLFMFRVGGKGGIGGILAWYCIYVVRSDAVLGVMNAVIGTASVPGMLLAPLLAKKIGKRSSLIWFNLLRAGLRG